MADTNVKFSVNGIEIKPEDMELFMKFHIIEANGSFNMAQYQKWFMYSVEKKTEKDTSPEAVLKATAVANKVKDKVLEDNKVENKDVLPDDGGMNPEQYMNFLLKRSDFEAVKELTKQMVHDTLEKENADPEITNPEEKLDDAITLVLPVIEFAQATGDEKKFSNTVDYFADALEHEGFKREDIMKKLDPVALQKAKGTAEASAIVNKEKYNPYIDWRYLYYMCVLKADTRRIEQRTIKMMFGEGHKKEEKEPEFKEPRFRFAVCDMSYTKDAEAFEKKYGYVPDLEKLRKNLVGIKDNEHYKMFFKNMFTKIYKKTQKNVSDISELISDADNLFQAIAHAEGRSNLPVQGGLNGNEFREFLLDLRGDEISVTRRMKNEIEKMYGTDGTSDAALIAGFIQQKFVEKMSVDDPVKQGDCMREAVAAYKVLKDNHEARPKSYMFLHPFKYHTEAKAIKFIEKTINEVQDESKKKMFEEFKSKKEIFTERAESEVENIRTMSIQLDMNQFEVVDSKAMRIDVPIDNDPEPKVKPVEHVKEPDPIIKPNEVDPQQGENEPITDDSVPVIQNNQPVITNEE